MDILYAVGPYVIESLLPQLQQQNEFQRRIRKVWWDCLHALQDPEIGFIESKDVTELEPERVLGIIRGISGQGDMEEAMNAIGMCFLDLVDEGWLFLSVLRIDVVTQQLARKYSSKARSFASKMGWNAEMFLYLERHYMPGFPEDEMRLSEMRKRWDDLYWESLAKDYLDFDSTCTAMQPLASETAEEESNELNILQESNEFQYEQSTTS